MPEETKKNMQKGNPKEQRKRRGRQHVAPVEKKIEKVPTPTPAPPKVAEPDKPAYEPPGPEFYKSLKRETDEILKITEEANAKYKKKEIQSNWAKYEMPIETYEEIDEQENLGADYEALIQAPLSVGGHFQFKHEKSWNLATGPTDYDKYFDINMENLNLALSAIPFYERNAIDLTIFNDNEIKSMNHRATKFKQKYYNDKNFTTPEMEAHDKILKNLKSEDKSEPAVYEENSKLDDDQYNDKLKHFKDINLEECENESEEVIELEMQSSTKDRKETQNKELENEVTKSDDKELIKPENEVKKDVKSDYEVKVLKENTTVEPEMKVVHEKVIGNKLIDDEFDEFQKEIDKQKVKEPENQIQEPTIQSTQKEESSKVTGSTQKEPINPVIKSTDDLEKWLDDFLDG